MSFASLGLSEPIVRAVTELGYTQPTPIQTQAIPVVLSGGDLLAGAQTGTGKTAGFTLPILQLLSTNPPLKTPIGARRTIRALMLAPTRELAAQIEESVTQYSRHLKLTSMTVFGGVNINPQIRHLQAGVDILVATPGRLLDHIGQRTVDLSGVEILVLDEADRMLDMGFIRDIRKILALLPRKRQNLLFSATFSDEIKTLADDLLNRPAMIEVARRNAPAELVDQKVVLVDKNRKRQLLSKLIQDNNWFQVLVFTRTKHGANRLAELLNKDGISALAIHGNKSQGARTRALAEFKDASLQVLVATDIAARGIDINELPHVVNFELPNVAEDYVHRIGRTGRAGLSGEALSLVCVDEHKFLMDIERMLKRQLPRIEVPGFEPDLSVKPVPIPMGRGARGQQYDDGLGESNRPPMPAGGRGGRGGQRPSQGGRPGQGSRTGQAGPQGHAGPGQAGVSQGPRAGHGQGQRAPHGQAPRAAQGAQGHQAAAPAPARSGGGAGTGPASAPRSAGLGFRGTNAPRRGR
ncbi:DEAD/DEAH box helicase [Quisquiliibacterium transsilvanicum]|uniref:ATP-dependent RNA helicase RhlE n=1 Tax=Quisquiliibacterium transsilvanicum TaxID=1549638 RepID=A0A7W8M8H7_9BURK|nr:DEAD/DEAH box helicase [Quisquiliibacterium transsilvanicum]MBB5271662.1 ATP-dependent RNA helicase RhlE [Quisquiliibacterium transsilvanicum]